MRWMIIFLMCVATAPVFASTIVLKDGRTVAGEIIERTPEAVRVQANGSIVTYFMDEIASVDEAVKPAPALQEQALPKVDMARTVDAEKKELIVKFMDVFGSRQALQDNFSAMLAQVEKTRPQEAEKLRNRVSIDEIIQALIPVYDQNFTSEELQAFIKFYGSPEGEKLIAVIPILMRQSVEVSTQYLQGKFPEESVK